MIVKHEKLIFEKLKRKSLRILHFSDFHCNNKIKQKMQILDDLINMDFDFAVFTGDLIVNDIEEFYPFISKFKQFAKKHQLYFVDGNHDIFYAEEIKSLLTSFGVKVLYNAKEDFCIHDIPITIIGTRDYWTLERKKFSELNELFKNIDNNRFILTLSHQPQIINKIVDFCPDLVLSGHTHGGQLRLPLFKTIYAPGQGLFPKYGSGLYKIQNTYLYISTGIGETHFSLRTFNPPSVSIIDIN